MRPNDAARRAQKAARAGPKKGGSGEKAAAIKIGRDSGRVKVFVRVRPLKPQEVSRKETVAVEVSELNSSIHVSDPKHSYEKDFSFDHVFPSEATNHEVCNTLCKPIVTSALNGFNGTLMAYGQTGSGKTYTLMAPDGIVAGVVDRCFKRMMQDIRHDYKVSMSYLQIYQEKIYDLLNSTNKVDLSIREHPSKGVYVENLSEFVVRSPSEVMNLLAVGKKRLVFAETKMNRTSSRSHSVCMLIIERTLSKEEGTKPKDCVPNGDRKSPTKDRASSLSKRTGSPKKTLAASPTIPECPSDTEGDEEQDSLAKMTFTDDVLVRGRIHLCDLAGSERLKKTQAEGERLSEAQHINSSLLELGNVIHALADGTKTHVPFRNSTLTRLLQESLGGNCKTSLIVCVSPTMNDVSETKGTLYFGSRAMKITNTAYVNVEVDYKKLSDDLSKMLNSREKDLDDLKQSYENRIEKIKQEAEGQINSSMTAAQEALSAVRSLFESKDEELKNEMHQIDEELQREKHLSSELQQQLSSLSTCLHGGVYRAKSALLAELLSMQIFYTIRDMQEEERQEVAKAIHDEYLYSGKKLVGVRGKVLENTDNVLQLFKSYLKLFNNSGKEMANCGLNLKELEDAFLNASDKNMELVSKAHESFELLDSKSELEKLELVFNKTDDVKVMESERDIEDESHELRATDFLHLTKNLRDKLGTIKGSLDGDAIEFLKKAFALDDDKECNRKQVYGVMMEFLRQRESRQEGTDSQVQSTIPMLQTEITLLDQSLCHVLVDKALQSSILLLESSESKKESDQLLKNNTSLNKDLDIMRHQVETLVSENTKLNCKLSETSTFLQDIKSSKELLESDLSSVFQLYNMRTPPNGRSALTEPDSNSNITDGISTLVEENAKLKVELKDTQEEKRDLLMQLENAKEELEEMANLVETLQKRSNAKASKSTQTLKTLSENGGNSQLKDGVELDEKYKVSTQLELTMSNEHSKSPKVDIEDENNTKKISVSKKLVDIEQFLINLQDELDKLEDDESALFMHTNQRQVVSSLRLNLNKRLGELWSIEVVESKKLRARVDELTIKLESATYDYEKQIEDLEKELHNEMQARLNLENELLQYRKEVMDLGAEMWTSQLSSNVEHTRNEVRNTGEEPTPRDETDSARIRSSLSLSISGCNSDDSLHDNRKAELYLAELDTMEPKEELKSLKQTFLKVNQDLADSGKVRQEMEERFINLANENKAVTLKFKASEEKNHAMEEKLIHISAMKTTLQEELLKLNEVEHKHLEEKRRYKERIANFEVEKTQLKQELSQMEIKFTTMDNKYQEMNKELAETKKRLKEAQVRLKAREQELKDLHEAYDRLRSHILEDDSDRESLVEVKMKRGARASPTPSRIQSIQLVSRAKSQSKKKHPSFLAAKKKMSMKRSPRNQDEVSPRRNTLRRTGTIGKRGTLTGPRDSRTLTRRDSGRDSIKRTKGHERRTLKRDNEEDQKLKSELLLAKEQLIRLKGELTISNIQTANLGSHLTSLREDSNKLDVELSSMRRAPISKGANDDSGISNSSKNLETGLGNAKEKIIELQDKILTLRREKTTAEEKASHTESEIKQLRSDIYKARDSLERSQEVVKILNKEIELLNMKNQILQQRLTSYSIEAVQMFLPEKDGAQGGEIYSPEQSETFLKFDQEKLAQYQQDKVRLEKEIEQLSSEKVKFEDMQNLVQHLVDVEDEQALLKRRLRKAVKQAKKDGSEEDSIKTNVNNDNAKTEGKRMPSQRMVQREDGKLEEYYIENTALRCELDALRIYISNLENENKTVKYKLSVSESMHGNSDKKVLATLLASAKHEREELRETLNNVYSEKEDTEEALNVARIKNGRLQRELSLVSSKMKEFEKELDSLKTDSYANIPEKDKPNSSLTVEENSVVELIKGFLFNVGARNAKEKDIKEFAKALLSRKSQQTGVTTKSATLGQRPAWNSRSSPKHSAAKMGNKSSKVHVPGSRTDMQTYTSASRIPKPETSRTNSTSSGLRRLKPGTDRGIPEGMEDERRGNTKPNKPKSQEIKDDLSFCVNESPARDEVLIKRAWSLRDLFKRNTSTAKTPTSPQVINQ